MVRLKDHCEDEETVKKIISIPYGAIKRTTRFLLKLLKVKFQFLMVRLKDIFFYHHLHSN